LADSAALPLLMLSRHASRQIKVVLTGDGGDELFGGYRKYRRAATTMARSVLSSRIAPHLFQTRRLAACKPDTFNLRRIGSRVGMLLVPPLRSSYQRQHWEGWDRHRLYRPDVAAQLNGEFDAADGPRDDHSATRDPVNVMLQRDQENYLPDDLLLKTDYSTMA
jgi:asparagine synthase (glutamine-hydrolysing)